MSRNPKAEFFTNYLSLLRTDSKIESLVEHKRRNNHQNNQTNSRNNKKTQSQLTNYEQSNRVLIQHAYSAKEQKAIGFRKVNRASSRLTQPGMVNGSNARLLENRFFSMKSSPRGSQLTILSGDPKRPQIVQTQSPTLKAYQAYVESQ